MTNYMLLQHGNIRVPLLAQNGYWEFVLKDVKWKIPDCMERLYAYLIYCDFDSDLIPGTLRANNKHITPAEIDAFVTYFKDAHPVTEELFSLDAIPLYATEDAPLYIPNAYTSVTITPEQERELLELKKKKKSLYNWFFNYVTQYNIGPKREDELEFFVDELVAGFYRQHGISIIAKEFNVERIGKALLILFLFIVPFWMFIYGADHNYFWLTFFGAMGILIVIGIIREWIEKYDKITG